MFTEGAAPVSGGTQVPIAAADVLRAIGSDAGRQIVGIAPRLLVVDDAAVDVETDGLVNAVTA